MKEHVELPEGFSRRMAQQLGGSQPDLLAALDSAPPTAIRINPDKRTRIQGISHPVPWCGYGRYLSQRPKFHLDPLWHAGTYYVQDASSMFLEQMWRAMDLNEDPMVLDACAAPGGKSTHLLSLLEGRGLLVANEIIPKRNRILVENIIKWGALNQVVLQAGSDQLLAACGPLGGFDVVVVDAPCSGEGLFRKDQTARQEWSPEHVASCARRQSLLLDDMQQLVRPGGYLVYSTCTWSEIENEDQVQRLLDSGMWESADPQVMLLPGIEPGSRGLGYRFYPHRVQGEGLYMAMLRKKGSTPGKQVPYRSTANSGNAEFQGLEDWADISGMDVIREGNHANLFPKSFTSELQKMRRFGDGRLVRYYGVAAGAAVREEFRPFHSLALSGCVQRSLPAIDLDPEAAIAYIGKEPPSFNPGYTAGWNLVRFKGINLGWAKVLDRRINNYYPKPWSIRR